MKKYLLIFIMILGLSSCDNKETTNSVYIQGGGTLDDWANLSKYKESNKILMSEIDENRVVLWATQSPRVGQILILISLLIILMLIEG